MKMRKKRGAIKHTGGRVAGHLLGVGSNIQPGRKRIYPVGDLCVWPSTDTSQQQHLAGTLRPPSCCSRRRHRRCAITPTCHVFPTASKPGHGLEVSERTALVSASQGARSCAIPNRTYCNFRYDVLYQSDTSDRAAAAAWMILHEWCQHTIEGRDATRLPLTAGILLLLRVPSPTT